MFGVNVSKFGLRCLFYRRLSAKAVVDALFGTSGRFEVAGMVVRVGVVEAVSCFVGRDGEM